MKCPCCDIGTATAIVVRDPMTIRGVEVVTDMKFNICDYCQSEFATPEDVRFNHQQVVDFFNQPKNPP